MVWDLVGDSARAHAWFEERRRLAPEVESEIAFFRLFSRRGHVDAAAAAIERTAAIEPDHWLVHQSRAILQLLRGEAGDAVASLLRYEQTEDPEWDPPTLLAFAYQMAGEQRRADSTATFAQALAERFREQGDQGVWIPETFASVAALEGRLNEAVDFLEEAVAKGHRGAHLMRYQFTHRPLWGHERFEALVDRVRQLDAAERERALALTTFPDGYPPERR